MKPEKRRQHEPLRRNFPAGHWARQGIGSFMAAQRILLDLAAQENALLIGHGAGAVWQRRDSGPEPRWREWPIRA